MNKNYLLFSLLFASAIGLHAMEQSNDEFPTLKQIMLDKILANPREYIKQVAEQKLTDDLCNDLRAHWATKNPDVVKLVLQYCNSHNYLNSCHHLGDNLFKLAMKYRHMSVSLGRDSIIYTDEAIKIACFYTKNRERIIFQDLNNKHISKTVTAAQLQTFDS